MNNINQLEYGRMALEFKNSPHWNFFLLLCGDERDKNLRVQEPTDATTQLQRFAMAQMANALPDAVEHAIKVRAKILEQAESDKTPAGKLFAQVRRAFSQPNPS